MKHYAVISGGKYYVYYHYAVFPLVDTAYTKHYAVFSGGKYCVYY